MILSVILKQISGCVRKNQAAQNGERYPKKSSADIRTKVELVRSNAHKYSISAMCKCLRIVRSTYYYESSRFSDETDIEDAVEAVFNQNRKVYGGWQRILFGVKDEHPVRTVNVQRHFFNCSMRTS
jgi:hypothetical protein